jgi:predicted dehydrogenase
MPLSRRNFFTAAGLGLAAIQAGSSVAQVVDGKVIPGFDQTATDIDPDAPWKPISDRKIKMGLVGYGVCKFATQFGLQNHPNVEVVAVSDLFPERCAELAQAAKCSKTYPSLEELVKDKSIEAVFVATDAPNHAQHCIEVLKHDKHVATAVPAAFDVESADRVFEMVKKSGLIYSMFETSAYHDNCYAMRKIYKAGGFGEIIYSEGEYYHYAVPKIDSYKGWRVGLPPMWYPTHSTAYYICVTGGSFTSVSCQGYKSGESVIPKNRYNNEFGSEIALFRTSKGGSSRMLCAWDIQGNDVETGRNFGEKGSFVDRFNGTAEANALVAGLKLKKPQLPSGVSPGGHGGSHGYLGNDFVEAILLNRRPLVDIIAALNLTVPGIIAHQSALKDGELLKVPQYALS